MTRFNGIWTPDLVKDLIISHTGRSHRETAIHLSNKHSVEFSRDSIKNKFVSLAANTTGEQTEPLKNRDSFENIKSDEGKKGKRTYIISSIIPGCPIENNFLKSIQKYCKENRAKLVLLPMRGIASKLEEFSEEVLGKVENSIYTEYVFNSNIIAKDLFVSPSQGNPLTGLENIAEKTSIIIASPKQNFSTIPVGNIGIPHILASTGSISQPSYSNNKIGVLSASNHVIGAIILEVEDDEIFHFRQIQANRDGSFNDISKLYTPYVIKTVRSKALVLGDLHCGFESKSAMKAWKEVISTTKPEKVVIHDLFDGRSISHWIDKDLSQKGNRSGVFKFLETELNNTGRFLRDMTKMFPKVNFIISRSNHDEFLDRYLSSARFVDDPHNYRLALELAIYQFDGHNPLQKYIEKNFPDIKNVTWLKRDQDYKIEGVLVSAHGDEGANGSRGSAIGLSKVYHNCIIGHSHSPRVYNKTWQVGTSTVFDMPYVSGPSSWLHCSCSIFEKGNRQFIISIDGKWKL